MGSATEAFKNHCEAWDAQDRDRWMSLFSPAVVLEDPVGVAPKIGQEALDKTWDRSHREGRRWTLEPRRLVECQNEVAVDLINHGAIDGQTLRVESIEIWRVDDDGKIDLVRVFFDPDPAVNDPYYVPQ